MNLVLYRGGQLAALPASVAMRRRAWASVASLRGLGASPLVVAIAQAISKEEGFGIPGTRPTVNHNPGDLISWGSYPRVNGFAQFPDDATGWAALYSQVQLNINRGLNLYQFFAGLPGVYGGYAPGGSGGNDPVSYAVFVAGQVGIDPSAPLSSLDPSNYAVSGPAAPVDSGSADVTAIDTGAGYQAPPADDTAVSPWLYGAGAAAAALLLFAVIS